MSGLVLKSRPAVSLGRRCLSLSAVSSTEKHTMPNPIDHATGENPRVPDPRYILSDPEPVSHIDAYRYLLVAIIELATPDPRQVCADPDPVSHIDAYRYRYPDP